MKVKQNVIFSKISEQSKDQPLVFRLNTMYKGNIVFAFPFVRPYFGPLRKVSRKSYGEWLCCDPCIGNQIDRWFLMYLWTGNNPWDLILKLCSWWFRKIIHPHNVGDVAFVSMCVFHRECQDKRQQCMRKGRNCWLIKYDTRYSSFNHSTYKPSWLLLRALNDHFTTNHQNFSEVFFKKSKHQQQILTPCFRVIKNITFKGTQFS